MSRHVPVYRPLLLQSLKTAWLHRELWPIAAVAGLAGTGAVINDVLNQAKLALAIPTSDFSQAFGNLHVLGVYRDQILSATPWQISLGTFIVLGLVCVALLLIATCQQVILRAVHLALHHNERLTLAELRHELSRPHILRILTLDIFLKLIIANLVIASTILISKLNVSFIFTDAVFGTIFSAAALSLALTVNILIMIALIQVATRDLSVPKALQAAWRLYRKNSFIWFEISMVLFAFNFAASLAYDASILLIGIPAVFAFIAALQFGSMFIYITCLTLALLIVTTLTLAFAGFTTTFTYTTWTGLADLLDKQKLTARTVVHSKRFLEHLK